LTPITINDAQGIDDSGPVIDSSTVIFNEV